MKLYLCWYFVYIRTKINKKTEQRMQVCSFKHMPVKRQGRQYLLLKLLYWKTMPCQILLWRFLKCSSQNRCRPFVQENARTSQFNINKCPSTQSAPANKLLIYCTRISSGKNVTASVLICFNYTLQFVVALQLNDLR